MRSNLGVTSQAHKSDLCQLMQFRTVSVLTSLLVAAVIYDESMLNYYRVLLHARILRTSGRVEGLDKMTNDTKETRTAERKTDRESERETRTEAAGGESSRLKINIQRSAHSGARQRENETDGKKEGAREKEVHRATATRAKRKRDTHGSTFPPLQRVVAPSSFERPAIAAFSTHAIFQRGVAEGRGGSRVTPAWSRAARILGLPDESSHVSIAGEEHANPHVPANTLSEFDAVYPGA